MAARAFSRCNKAQWFKVVARGTGSALDHIELTYHDVTVFAIPEFKSLEVLEKKYFCINIIVNQPQN